MGLKHVTVVVFLHLSGVQLMREEQKSELELAWRTPR